LAGFLATEQQVELRPLFAKASDRLLRIAAAVRIRILGSGVLSVSVVKTIDSQRGFPHRPTFGRLAARARITPPIRRKISSRM